MTVELANDGTDAIRLDASYLVFVESNLEWGDSKLPFIPCFEF